jgi:uncharacterized protein
MARAAIAAALAAGCAPSWVPPVPAEHVTDAVGLMTTDERRNLNHQLEAYEARTGHQVIVWVSETLPTGVSIERFALRAFNAWGIGRKRFDDGVALFMFIGPRKARIAVGYGLEDKIPDAEAVRIIQEEIAPHTQAGHWSEGITTGVRAIIAAIGDPP